MIGENQKYSQNIPRPGPDKNPVPTECNSEALTLQQLLSLFTGTSVIYVYRNKKKMYIHMYGNLFTVEYILRFVTNHLSIYDFDVQVTVHRDKFLQ